LEVQKQNANSNAATLFHEAFMAYEETNNGAVIAK